MRITSINRFVFAALLCCGMFFTYHDVRAQSPSCPSGYTGPVGIADYLPSSGCEFMVYYCDSIYAGGDSDKRFIDEIDFLNDSCPGINDTYYDSLVLQAAQIAMLDPASVPWCSQGTLYVRTVYSAYCWQRAIVPPGQPGKLTPCQMMTELGHCIYSCAMCRDDASGHIEKYDCSYTTDGFQPDCSTDSKWNPGECEVVGCPSD